MKSLYNMPILVQWIISIVLFIGGIMIMGPVLTKSPYGFFALPIIAPIFNLATVPFFRLIGYYKYLNPYVLSTVQTNKSYDLHNIFTFDYLLNFKWSDRGIKAQKILLGHYFKALLTIIERIESGKLAKEVKIVGHSYFFSDRTAEKLGFTISKASSFWVCNSALQFIELSYLYSFSQGKIAMPKFWKVKRAEITGSDLIKQKEKLQTLEEKILQQYEA